MIQWIWELYEEYIRRRMERANIADPTEEALAREFLGVWKESWGKLMVQEPWMGTIRFKTLARLEGQELEAFAEEPVSYIQSRYGGGKFKINLYHGLSFVATQNFKPDGPRKWEDLPELEMEI